jgi:hypothetical protein
LMRVVRIAALPVSIGQGTAIVVLLLKKMSEE